MHANTLGYYEMDLGLMATSKTKQLVKLIFNPFARLSSASLDGGRVGRPVMEGIQFRKVSEGRAKWLEKGIYRARNQSSPRQYQGR